MSNQLAEAYTELWNNILLEADYSGEPQQACFFQIYSDLATENGDCTDLTYTPVRKEGGHGYQVDGYAIDPERGELHLAVCDFRAEDEVQSLVQGRIESLFGRAERFFLAALKPEFLNSLEETSPAFEAAYPIHAHASSIKRVRVTIFSNGRLASRKKGVDSKKVAGRTFTHNLLDFLRYVDISNSRTGSEPIEIDLEELSTEPVTCIQAHTGGSRYKSYLVAMPGELIAKIYGLYGARLLEQNVRTFLQARTKVNRGIIETIAQSPEMFFAYNNGLTATAAGITTESLPDGGVAIRSIENLQIVNGGQTTASILYANDKHESDLSQVYVQVKLSVIAPDQVESIVPKISRFANTQNRISEADFFSSHPFHVEMEKVSRRLSAPQKPGAFASTKWFYERARGQYKDSMAYGTSATRQRFVAEYPKDQVIVKTDLAKSEITFECLPHVVSQGAQKCFLEFAEEVGRAWEADSDSFSESYFKNVVAKTIAFRWTDSMVAKSDWYRDDRGYKANIVTYTLAWLIHNANAASGSRIDLERIWSQQDLSDELKLALEVCAPRIAKKIKDAPAGVKNVSEYCKRQACWAAVSKLEIDLGVDLGGVIVARSETKQRRKDRQAAKKLDNEVEFDVDKLYDGEESSYDFPTDPKDKITRSEDIAARRKSRTAVDTIVIPTREEGFHNVFIGKNQWYAIRIGASMKQRLKYIAAYQVAPKSAVTHIAEVSDIHPYKDTGKYCVVFKGPAQEIKPIKIKDTKNAPQSHIYVRRDDLISASYFEDAFPKGTKIKGKKAALLLKKMRPTFTGTKPKSLTLRGYKQEVALWIEVLYRLCDKLLKDDRVKFASVLSLRGKKRPYFSRNKDELRKPQNVTGTDIYVETNLGSNLIVKLSRELITLFGYDSSELHLEVEEKK